MPHKLYDCCDSNDCTCGLGERHGFGYKSRKDIPMISDDINKKSISNDTDWDKRVRDAASINLDSKDWDCCGTSDIVIAQQDAFTAGANWAREEIEKEIENLRQTEKVYHMNRDWIAEAKIEIKALRQQCEALAAILEKVLNEYDINIKKLQENKVEAFYTWTPGLARNVLARYKKFKEGMND